jgi:predicted secreted acid phosphatase
VKRLASFRRSPRLTIAITTAVIAGLAAAVAFAAEPAIQTFTPRSEKQITNIDVLRQQIKNYYGDPLAVTGTGPTATWNTHPLNLDSNYAHEAESVADDGTHWLKARSHARYGSKTKAIVLDVDDTTLATWNYEIFSNWDFSPGTNGDFVTQELFPPVPGMVEMVSKAAQEGYAIFFITGRPAVQEAATLGNLTQDGIGVDAGYPQPTTLKNSEDGLFTKPAVADYPPYLQAACADEISQGKSCTTIHYKSATRAHIESVGYEIVADFGDQFSDLKGGFADKTFKLPNPNYFLP